MPRILSWNINHRSAGIVKILMKHDTDCVILTECNQKSVSHLTRELPTLGYSQSAHTNPEGRDYGIVIASKTALEPVISDCGKVHPVRWQCVNFSNFAVRVLGVHIPNFADKKWNKVAFWDDVLEFAHENLSSDAIIMGDFNTGLAVDCTGVPFKCQDKFQRLLSLGWQDARRSVHPDVREYSWYSHAGNGFRVDQVFVSPSLISRVVDCFYSHEERLNKLSDHSPLLIELN
jgi:exodeoxyribonuclease-3